MANSGLQATDALILVDMQNDFMPGGALAVASGDEIVTPLNRLAAEFERRGLPVVATRDWHPAKHCSFQDQGGPWPPHCVAATPGAEFHPALSLPKRTHLVSKATSADRDAYSGFDHTELGQWLTALNVKRLLIGGLATDYCVLHTVLDGLRAGFRVVVLEDAVRAVNVQPDDGSQALQRMRSAGAALTPSSAFVAAAGERR